MLIYMRLPTSTPREHVHGVVHHEIGVAHGVQIQAKMPTDSPARLDLNGLHIVVPAHGRLNLLIEQR